MMFKQPQNGYIIETSLHGLWAFLFGFLYFMKHGVWSHAIIYIFVVPMTFGIAWLIYPFFAKDIIRNHYLKNGWEQLQ